MKKSYPATLNAQVVLEVLKETKTLNQLSTYTAHPFYGSRKPTVLLEPEFAPINRKRVQRYMREMGIAGIDSESNLSKRSLEDRIYPYLLRNITAQAPNHIWGCDITYVRLRGS